MEGESMSNHIALLGDSIFDNRAYTDGDPDVVNHLRDIMPSPWRASLYAIDGDVTTGLKAQLEIVTRDVSHFVISVGGNDALSNMDILATPVNSTTEALMLFANRVAIFEESYRSAIDEALKYGLPTTICTIYNANLGPEVAALARIALMMFNDVILRVAFERHLAVIDLRLICNEPADYALEIEPSGRGGCKIAAAISSSILGRDGSESRSRVFAG